MKRWWHLTGRLSLMNSNSTFSRVPYVLELTLMHGGDVLLQTKTSLTEENYVA